MDTDDLSDEAYMGIFIEAEKLNHTLTVRFGVLAYSCKNEKEYLEKARKFVENLMRADASRYPDIFFDEIPEKKSLLITLTRISNNISELEKKLKS